MKFKIYRIEKGEQIKLGEIELSEFSNKTTHVNIEGKKHSIKSFKITDKVSNIYVSKPKKSKITW